MIDEIGGKEWKVIGRTMRTQIQTGLDGASWSLPHPSASEREHVLDFPASVFGRDRYLSWCS